MALNLALGSSQARPCYVTGNEAKARAGGAGQSTALAIGDSVPEASSRPS